MRMFDGWKTILMVIMGELFAFMQAQGIIVPEDDQAAIQTGIVAMIALILRHVTTGKAGWRK